VREQPATPKRPEPKPRATIPPLQSANYPTFKERTAQQQQTMATSSTSSLMKLETQLNDEVQRLLNDNSVGTPNPVKKVKRLQNSQAAGVAVRRVGSFIENSAPQAGAGRKTTAGKMPPIYQGNFFQSNMLCIIIKFIL
jgi:hypothetical protein